MTSNVFGDADCAWSASMVRRSFSARFRVGMTMLISNADRLIRSATRRGAFYGAEATRPDA